MDAGPRCLHVVDATMLLTSDSRRPLNEKRRVDAVSMSLLTMFREFLREFLKVAFEGSQSSGKSSALIRLENSVPLLLAVVLSHMSA